MAAPRLRVHELLAMLPSCCVRMDELLSALPRLGARYYSVASSPLGEAGTGESGTVAFAFSVVRYATEASQHGGLNGGIARDGVCTTWLERLLSNALASPTGCLHLEQHPVSVDVFLKPSDAFKLPDDDNVPILMVGPGTGVAPFIGTSSDSASRFIRACTHTLSRFLVRSRGGSSHRLRRAPTTQGAGRGRSCRAARRHARLAPRHARLAAVRDAPRGAVGQAAAREHALLRLPHAPGRLALQGPNGGLPRHRQ